MNELELSLRDWDHEAQKPARLMRALPGYQYDLRSDPQGCRLGELARHLAEGDAQVSFVIKRGGFSMGETPPASNGLRGGGLGSRGYERAHSEAAERVRRLKTEDLARSIPFFTGESMSLREVL